MSRVDAHTGADHAVPGNMADVDKKAISTAVAITRFQPTPIQPAITFPLSKFPPKSFFGHLYAMVEIVAQHGAPAVAAMSPK